MTVHATSWNTSEINTQRGGHITSKRGATARALLEPNTFVPPLPSLCLTLRFTYKPPSVSKDSVDVESVNTESGGGEVKRGREGWKVFGKHEKRGLVQGLQREGEIQQTKGR